MFRALFGAFEGQCQPLLLSPNPPVPHGGIAHRADGVTRYLCSFDTCCDSRSSTSPQYLIEDGIDSLERLHGSICECVWDTGRGGWRMLRERTDKTLPVRIVDERSDQCGCLDSLNSPDPLSSPDPPTPRNARIQNAWSVYQSVVKTIEENISVEELVELGESKARPAGKAKDGQGAAQGNGGATVAGDANGAAKLD